MHFQNCQGALLIRVGLSKLTEFICFLCLVRPFLNERREMVRCICIVCEKKCAVASSAVLLCDTIFRLWVYSAISSAFFLSRFTSIFF